uniref:Uncharacterized protein n=1 Tax=Timema monikensis TaxID=170555 RepID=A0A7R9HRC1_9NEOP|nr:unnamed protein product [Timema monikensis]
MEGWEVVLRKSSDRMKPRPGDWAVTIDSLSETAITSLSSGSNHDVKKGCCDWLTRREMPPIGGPLVVYR